ncbi:unnamed protein product, partial [marine sediment metagenome]
MEPGKETRAKVGIYDKLIKYDQRLAYTTRITFSPWDVDPKRERHLLLTTRAIQTRDEKAAWCKSFEAQRPSLRAFPKPPASGYGLGDRWEKQVLQRLRYAAEKAAECEAEIRRSERLRTVSEVPSEAWDQEEKPGSNKAYTRKSRRLR